MGTHQPRVAQRAGEQDLRADTVEAYARVLGGPGPGRPPGEPIPLPPALNAMSVEDAYTFQRQVLADVREQWDAAPVGYKISATNAADQAVIDASEPTYGLLTDRHLLASDATIDLALANHPLVEPELLMRTSARIDPDAGLDELAASVECAGALEVPVSRFAGWWPLGEAPRLTLSGLIADNSVAGFVVAGVSWRSLTSEEIGALEVRLDLPDGEIIVGRSSRVLGHPLRALTWLAGRLARTGEELPVGSIVSTGTFAAPSRGRPGTYRATFGSGLGPVVVRFV